MGTRHRPSPAHLVVVLVVLLLSPACARTLARPAQVASPVQIGELWQEPTNLETCDLFVGAGGQEWIPPARPFAFVATKTSGTNPGYDVRDAQGRIWSVKLGEEAGPEVVLSRILWALGYHQPVVHYVDAWQMTGGDRANQPAGRFRANRPGEQASGNWSWYENPFIGTRPYAALIAINLLFNNWDFKTSNNTIYVAELNDGRRARRYAVRDLGGSLGRARQPCVLRWIPFMRHGQGTKNSIEDFEAQPFVAGVREGRVEFDYRGLDQGLVDHITVADLRWTVQLLSLLSEQQWLDAFRAGGYDDTVRARYVRRIQQKLGEARAVSGLAS